MLASQPQYREPGRHRNLVPKASPTERQAPRNNTTRTFPEPPVVLVDRKKGYRFTRGGILGEGGFARCYEAFDSKGEQFAVKVIAKASLTTSKQRAKLVAEIRIHQMLSHPNIVGFKHCFEDDDFVYMILELCENKTFVEMLRKRRRLTEPEVCHYMWQLLDAVREVHRRGVIHRDLKLGNLFLTRDMQLKLGDFGLAAMIKHDGERKKTICGTPNYIAPEVLFDTQTGHSFEVDIWSLGVVMYTLLIGKPPFQTKDVKAIYKKIRDNSYEFPPQIAISRSAKDIITGLLQSRPERRPSVDDIMQHEYFAGQPVIKSIPISALTIIPDFLQLPAKEPSSAAGRSVLTEASASKALRSSNSLPGSDRQPSPSHNSNELNGQTDALLAKDFDRLKIDSENRPPIPSSWMRRQQSSDSQSGRAKSSTSSGRTQGARVVPMPTPDPDSSDADVANGPNRSSSSNSSASKHEVEPRAPPSPQSDGASTFKITSPETVRARNSSYNSPRPAENPRKSVNVLQTMYQNLQDGLSSDRIGTRRSDEMEEVSAPRIFITKWIDYSNKYGLGYQLRDGSVGVYFNDSTSIILAADNHHFEYLYYDKGSDRTVMHRKAYTMTQHPEDLLKKVTLMKHFRGYMQDNLFKACKHSTDDAPRTQNLDFLTKYLRTKHGVIFRLSNHIVQLNLFDHSKVILSNDGRVVTYIDQNREFTTKSLSSFVGTGNKDIIDRLKYMREVLYQMLVKKQRKSSGEGCNIGEGGA
ncbi:hypothetical protein SpCBS45565_g02977 [Spizellomyces sp. 'palustris']|nr:hypothetical protein SpCBS45565_g02977 [Spizellomyces sp. 'palustris']